MPFAAWVVVAAPAAATVPELSDWAASRRAEAAGCLGAAAGAGEVDPVVDLVAACRGATAAREAVRSRATRASTTSGARGAGSGRDPFAGGSGKRGGDDESYDRAEAESPDSGHDTGSAADAYESEAAEEAGYEDDAGNGGDDADFGGDDGGGDATDN